MPHIALVPFTGLRVREQSMRELGMSLPGLSTRATEIAHLPALGLLTLAGLTPDDWTQSYHESATSKSLLVDSIIATKPTVAAFSALTASIHEAYDVADEVRQAGIPVVIGGLHATTCSDEVRQHCDAVVIGEGESVWLQILSDAAAGTLQPVYRADAPFELARSPLPRFDLLPAGARPRMTVQTQRGCPFACDFCGASRLLGPFRRKPVELIARELRAIRQVNGSRLVELADDNTFAGGGDHSELLDALAGSKIKYFTEADWRIGLNQELLKRLALSGCVQVLVGIESLVHVHGGMGAKASRIEQMMEAIAKIQAHGIAVIGCFIVGSDGETRESIDALAKFIIDADLADIQLTLLTPFPGTALYARLKKQGRLLADRDWTHYTLFDVTYQPDRMSACELETAFRELITTVFSDALVARRSRRKREIWKSKRTV